MKTLRFVTCSAFAATCAIAPSTAHASSIVYSNLTTTNQLGAASRPETAGKIEIEAADDFVLGSPTAIDKASFIGLLPAGSNVSEVAVEIYRVFPKDSQDPPDGRVPTRVNSPSDVAFDTRDSADASLNFSTSVLAASFTANNSVLNGIHPLPTTVTGGEGPVTGQEVRFDVNFATPFLLPADHYFFVAQVALSSGNFFWLTATRPAAGVSPDLQAWIRNADLDPDWLRIGTDIIGGNPAPTFNLAFQLEGTATPEPGTMVLLGSGLLMVARRYRRR